VFKKIASDMLGLSDIGSVIKPQDYDKVDADDYVMHEDHEKIYFLIKSKTDEYCFTNKALIHVDGTSAVSQKRTLKRYNYYEHPISNVSLETAGTVDLDAEIKFRLGSNEFSIDVHKQFIEELKDLYKSLLAIAELMKENHTALEFAKESLRLSADILSRVSATEGNLVEQFKGLNETTFTWLTEKTKEYTVKDFGFVFEKYINN